jgi:hypothetical protein
MKKQLLFVSACIYTGLLSLAQSTPVSQSVEPKNAILEELTGIYCGFCPAGHKIAQEISDANPGRVVLVNIHAGGFAVPSSGDVDLRTTHGNTIDAWMDPDGYPSGSVQRKVSGGVLPQSRGDWSGMVNTVLAQTSPVNIALDASIDATTRVVTVNVEMYYTETQNPGTNHYLNVGILQDNIEGRQSGASSNPAQVLSNGNYLHNHAFRGYINTGAADGDMFDATQSGVITKTYTYTLPSQVGNVNLKIPDLKFFAFVGPGRNTAATSELFSAAEVSPNIVNIPGATAQMEGILNSFNIGCESPASISPIIEVYNKGQEITSLKFETTINGGTPYESTWTGSIGSYSTGSVTITGVPDFVPGIYYNNVKVDIVEVNGGNGIVGSTYSTTSNISKAKVVTGANLTVEIYTDNYPSETSWELLNSANVVVASGGGYTGDELTTGDALTTMTHDIFLTESDCYSFKMYDSYGDGMAYGSNPAGGFGFKIKKGSQTLYSVISDPFTVSTSTGSGNGKYELISGVLDFTFDTASLGVSEIENTINMNVYPNPAKDQVSVSFDAENIDYTINLIDITGRTIITRNYSSLNGKQNIELPLENIETGNYMLTLRSENGVVNKQISVE